MSLIDNHAISHTCVQRPAPVSIWTRLAVWRSRRALAKLDARGLQDIGITAEQARREAENGLWDVPPSWTRR
ncbi:MAG: DUF1127 domain-containing protein [Roseobacter sp.]